MSLVWALGKESWAKGVLGEEDSWTQGQGYGHSSGQEKWGGPLPQSWRETLGAPYIKHLTNTANVGTLQVHPGHP